jgi:hypothetical protein
MTKKRVWSLDEVQAWFVGRMPDGWFVEAPTVLADREEIVVVGRLPEPEAAGSTPGDQPEDQPEDRPRPGRASPAARSRRSGTPVRRG